MAENLDGLEIGNLYTRDYLKQTRKIENTRSLGILYDLKRAYTKEAKDVDVQDISRPGRPDDSPVYEVIQKGQLPQEARIANKTAFGEVLTANFEPLTGWSFTYNINPAIVSSELSNGGTISREGSSVKVSTGTDPAGASRVHTIRGSRYVPGVGGLCRFTAVFSEPQENAKQVIGIINTLDGWGFGYNGLKFGVVRIKDGVENWEYQEDWSENPWPMLNPQAGNVYEIRYQWLGYGMQYFSIENENGDLEIVHRIKYAGLNNLVSVTNPNLPISAYVINDGNTDDVWIKSPSAIAGLEGDAYNDAISSNIAGDFEGSIVAGTNVPIASFRMGENYKGTANRLFALALRLTLATEGNKPVAFRIYVDGTPTGGTWNYLSEEISPLEFNKTLTGFTGGVLVGAFGLGKSDSQDYDFTGSQFKLYQGQNVTLTATGTQPSEIVAALNWKSFL